MNMRRPRICLPLCIGSIAGVLCLLIAAPNAKAQETSKQNKSEGKETRPQTAEKDNSDSKKEKPRESSSKRESRGNEKSATNNSGPGNTELRSDYPGTDQAMKSKMRTDQLKGLQFEEGSNAENPYKTEMKELKSRVDNLKEEVFRSKSRIALLKETVLSGKLAGSRAIIIHISELGSQYALTQAAYSLDGEKVFNQSTDEGSISDKDQIEIYNGMVDPGHHNVGVLLRYKGSGYGVFSYMEDYKFEIKDSCEFEAIEGKNTIIEVRPIEKGNALTKKYKNRPKVECKTHTVDYSAEDIAKSQ